MTTTFKSDDQPFLVKKEKVHIRIVLIGHVNSGKSTTIHTLINQLGGTDKRNVEGSENEAAKAKKRTFKYAWVLNKLNSEYERGVTLDLDLWKFETSKYHCTIIDAPGHIKNMIIGISHADVGVLIIDSTISGFKAGTFKGGQTFKQALLAYTLGVKQMICCCNKMDAINPKYSEARFDDVKNNVSSCLTVVGYDPNIIPFVPISGLKGDNITESSTRLSWYMGPTLYQAFDLLVEFKSPSSKLSRHLEDEHRIGGLGTVLATRVKPRIRKPGMVVTFGSSRLETRVKSDNPLFATEEKVPVNILVIGHVKSGKSTITGHLIHRLGRIRNRYLQRLENEATEGNKKSSKYAWVLDKIKAEYKRDFSIDISLWKFETLKHYCTVFDAPGHRHLIKNMIIGTGTSQVDCAVLIIDSTTGAFEAGISKEGQTRGYALLAHTLGVKEMICCCNKMDATTPEYSQARYNEIKRSISPYLMKVGYNNNIPFIPISRLEGDNIIQYSRRLSWYKGVNLYLALDYINEPIRPIDEILDAPLEDVCKIGNIRNISARRVENSNLNSGMVASCGPYGLTTTVEMHHESLLEAFPADNVAFNVKNVAVKDCGHEASKSEDDPVKRVAVDKKDPTVT